MQGLIFFLSIPLPSQKFPCLFSPFLFFQAINLLPPWEHFEEQSHLLHALAPQKNKRLGWLIPQGWEHPPRCRSQPFPLGVRKSYSSDSFPGTPATGLRSLFCKPSLLSPHHNIQLLLPLRCVSSVKLHATISLSSPVTLLIYMKKEGCDHKARNFSFCFASKGSSPGLHKANRKSFHKDEEYFRKFSHGG